MSPRDVILARRARFVAAALATLTVASCEGEGTARACLAPVGGYAGMGDDAGPEADSGGASSVSDADSADSEVE